MSEKNAFLRQKLDKLMCDRRREVAGVKLLRELKESVGLVAEVVDLENGLRLREVEPLQVVVEAGAWCSKATTKPFKNNGHVSIVRVRRQHARHRRLLFGGEYTNFTCSLSITT